MTFGPIQVKPGMEVIGTTGAPIGHVTEATDEEFVVARTEPQAPVRLGYDKVRALLGSQIVLNVGPDQLDATA
jgi:hypothetical protein